MASVNLGKVGLLLRGDWDSDTDYAALDVVSHEGYAYAARVANKNVEPSAETAAYWQPLAESASVLATMLGYKNDAADSATAAAGSATAAATSASSATDALANEAADFSSSKAYAIGDYVIYNNGTHKYLYRFTAAHSAGAWVGTDAVQVALADDVSDLKSALNKTDTELSAFEDALSYVRSSWDGTVVVSTTRTFIPVIGPIKFIEGIVYSFTVTLDEAIDRVTYISLRNADNQVVLGANTTINAGVTTLSFDVTPVTSMDGINLGALVYDSSANPMSDLTVSATISATPNGALAVEAIADDLSALANETKNPERLQDSNLDWNLFNKHYGLENKSINRETGAIYNSEGGFVSDYISVQSGLKYTASHAATYAFYDSNKTVLNAGYDLLSTLAPNNAAWLRIAITDTIKDAFYVIKGQYRIPSAPFLVSYPWASYKVKPDDMTDAEYANMFDANGVINGVYVDTSTGDAIASSQQCSSVYIPVKPETSYSSNKIIRYALYDSNRQFISGGVCAANSAFTTPATAYWMIISMAKTDKDTAMLANSLYFSDNYETHHAVYVPWLKAQAPKSKYDGKKMICFGDSITSMGYVDTIYANTGIEAINVGLSSGRYANGGGTDKDKFAFHQIAYSISTGDWTIPDSIQGISGYETQYQHIQTIKNTDFSELTFASIAYGTNDFSSATTMDNDNNPYDVNTFKGAIRYSLKLIMEKHPHLKIIGVTPFYRFYSEDGAIVYDCDNYIIGGHKLADYVQATIETYTELHLPVINNLQAGVNTFNCLQYFNVADGLHPTANGRSIIGSRIGSGILLNY